MIYGLILAGGKGTRLYPLSRSARPKQFLKVINNKSFLQNTVDRVSPLIDKENIYIVTNKEYKDKVKVELENINSNNIFTEPMNKETATCIGLSAVKLLKKDNDAIMVVLPSDHHIENEKLYIETLSQAVEIANRRRGIVTLGITPARSETGYGYIEMGQRLQSDIPTYKVARFTEKPNLEVAKDFLLKGSYLWNSGMFIFRADARFTTLRCKGSSFIIICIHMYPPVFNRLVVAATSLYLKDLNFILTAPVSPLTNTLSIIEDTSFFCPSIFKESIRLEKFFNLEIMSSQLAMRASCCSISELRSAKFLFSLDSSSFKVASLSNRTLTTIASLVRDILFIILSICSLF